MYGRRIDGGAYGNRNADSKFVLHGQNVADIIDVKNMALGTLKTLSNERAGPRADGDERAVGLIASGHTNELTAERGRDRAEVHDGRRSRGIDVIEDGAVGSVGEIIRGSVVATGVSTVIGGSSGKSLVMVIEVLSTKTAVAVP